MTKKSQLVVQALLASGPTTYEELAKATALPLVEVSSRLREYRRNNKYGVVEVGRASPGSRKLLVAIDEVAYADYMERRAAREATQRPPAPKRKTYKCPRPVAHPVTGFCTQWQPASPYYQEAA